MRLSNLSISVIIAWLLSLRNAATTTSKSTTPTSTSTTATSTSTTASAKSFIFSKPKLNFKTTTGLRMNRTLDTDQTSKYSSSDGSIVIAVAVPIAIIVVAILASLLFILIYRKRKLCFKYRHVSGYNGGNRESTPQIPEKASNTPANVPPGSIH